MSYQSVAELQMVLKKDRVVCGGGGGLGHFKGNCFSLGFANHSTVHMVEFSRGGSVDRAFSCSDTTSNTWHLMYNT